METSLSGFVIDHRRQRHRPAGRPRALFEPYVTTREKGTGLGLPIVKKIIEEHGGTLELEDAPSFRKARIAARWRG
jgi:nitrogen fixation/metabolism regulation signal transduction histidine kinase